jgi:hypothetical protein
MKMKQAIEEGMVTGYNKVVELIFVPGYLNVADVLTKPLAFPTFTRHRDKLLFGITLEEYNSLIDNI